jgi:biotin transport system substrate-specific component
MSHTLTLERAKVPSWLRSTGIVLLSSFFVSLFAKVAIPLPFTPVPMVAQVSVILILSAFLGSKRASLAVLGFLAQAALGLPVLAGGVGGIAVLMGPTGGYCFGYLAAAFLVGYLFEKMEHRTPLKTFLALAAGNGVVFLFGVPYLGMFVGFENALALGFLPFIVPDLLKLFLGTKILYSLRPSSGGK